MKRLHVAVLMGGTSSEREVSLLSGARVAAAFDPAQFEVSTVDLADICGGEAARLGGLLGTGANGKPDVVFIALHGGTGENGTIQGLLSSSTSPTPAPAS